MHYEQDKIVIVGLVFAIILGTMIWFPLALVPIVVIVLIRMNVISERQVYAFVTNIFNKKKHHTTMNTTAHQINTMKIKRMFKIVPLFILGLVFLLSIKSFYFDVPAGHVGLIFDRGRGVLPTEFGEGIHLKIPWWQSAILMDTRLQTYTMSTHLKESDLINNLRAKQVQSFVGYSDSDLAQEAFGSESSNNSIDALTKDGQRVVIDLTVQYRINRDDASTIYQTIGLNYVDKVIRPAARSIARERVTAFNSRELFSEETRVALENSIRDNLRSNFVTQNINLEDVLVRHIGFSEVYLSAIEDKQVAEQKIEKAEFEKQEAEIRKEKTIIEAEAEAAAISLKGDALRRSPEVIQLEFVNKMAPQIDWGILPDGALPLLDLKQFGN